MHRSLLALGAALLGASTVVADQATCALDKKCPKEAPCCSQYGQCGIGAYCLGGCDPRMSFSLDSCVPAPVCKSATYKMDSLDRVVDVGKYLGDPKQADWVSQGEPLLYNGNVLLTMPAHSVGTVLASTTYMWYGSVQAKLKTGRGAGVVTAFILLSDVKDEIDYEFVGTELDIAQTNYYFQGIPDYVNSGNATGLSSTFDNFHTYKIDWSPDSIVWSVDGKVVRTKPRSETWNATANQWDFPQTPARVQLSIWPGGADTNAKGTIDWAGGPIDWNSDDIKNFGYDFATFGEVTVECYNAKTAPGTNLHTSYTFSNVRATNDTVVDGDKPTVLKSFLGTGLDMNAGSQSSGVQSSATATGTNAPSSAPVNSIPGGGSSGPGQAVGGDDAAASGSNGNNGSPTVSASGCVATSFSQDGCGSSSGSGSGSGSGSKNDGARVVAERTVGASAIAIVIAVVGLLWL